MRDKQQCLLGAASDDETLLTKGFFFLVVVAVIDAYVAVELSAKFYLVNQQKRGENMYKKPHLPRSWLGVTGERLRLEIHCQDGWCFVEDASWVDYCR